MAVTTDQLDREKKEIATGALKKFDWSKSYVILLNRSLTKLF